MLEEVFLKENLPYTIFSGVQFFARMEIKDALSYLRLIVLPGRSVVFAGGKTCPSATSAGGGCKHCRTTPRSRTARCMTRSCTSWDEPLFRGTKASELIDLVERYAGVERDIPVSELLSKILDESGYEAMRRTEGAQNGWTTLPSSNRPSTS